MARLIIFQTIPMLAVLVGIIGGDKGIPPYRLSVCNGGTVILFRGGLRAGAEQAFKRKLESAPGAGMLYIESHGGRATEGIRIGRLIKAAGLATYVSEHCESAATLMFISGKKRIIEPDAKIGFHRPSGKGLDDGEDETVRQFMKEAGISEDFINRVFSTSSDTMWYPSYDEMLRAGVVTGAIVDGKIYRQLPVPDNQSNGTAALR